MSDYSFIFSFASYLMIPLYYSLLSALQAMSANANAEGLLGAMPHAPPTLGLLNLLTVSTVVLVCVFVLGVAYAAHFRHKFSQVQADHERLIANNIVTIH